ncbi:methyl-CpG-binding domain-containing protein 7-like isoform X2 [Impatiens glandulifera]|uniref:methyl-CpG-binding domain-containing protein 7-like isoform X2 n=1 Tax=Impatiens glandulifera TaxID=253017 RepID=UPI001FB14088|nr:methyl-CpG-binding domain-containing protein 7-like isoform X2 [Impatiens glandulifera]
MDEDDDGSPSIVTPLTAIASDFHPFHDHNLQLEPFYPLTPASSTAKSPRFELPQGWEILEVPRSVGNQIDKYYYKPGSGIRFRSMKEVERYLSGHEYTPPPSRKTPTPQSKCISKSSQKKMVVSGGNLLKLDKISDRGQLTIVGSANTAGTSQFVLPDGWVVEEVPRKDLEHTDKYYYEPGTGQKFRSLVAVERYLSAMDIENAPLSKMFNLGNKRVKKSGSRRKRSKKDKKINSSAVASDFSRTHVKINWVLADPGGGSWNAFIGQSIIPEHIRQLWDKKFESSVNRHNP